MKKDLKFESKSVSSFAVKFFFRCEKCTWTAKILSKQIIILVTSLGKVASVSCNLKTLHTHIQGYFQNKESSLFLII